MANRQEILEHVTRLLDSEQFVASRSVAKLLTFCVDAALAGNQENLKETTIGIFCFGRSPGYDTKQDPIVRVTARRLRKKLELFYQNHGEDNELRILLPKGTYVPRFSHLSNPAAIVESSPDDVLPDDMPTLPEPVSATDAEPVPFEKISVEIQPALVARANWLKPATWSFLVFLLTASSAAFLARIPLHQEGKVVVLPEQPLRLDSFADHLSLEPRIPSIEEQIQLKRQLLSELSSLVNPTMTEPHEKLREHQITNSTEKIVNSVEPRL